MKRLIITARAEQDLLEIWQFIAKDAPVEADRFLNRLEKKCLLLCNFALMGKARPDLAAKLRSFPVGEYILYYRHNRSEIIMARVLHGAMDIDSSYFIKEPAFSL